MAVNAHVESAPLMERWWVHIPAMLRRYSVPLSEAWADGIYLTAWPRVSTILPLAFLFLGLVEGITHWCPHITGGIIGGGPYVVVFAQILPLLVIAVCAGALSGNLGLMLVIGYSLGDFFVAGPVRAAHNGSILWRLFHLRLPQLISYYLFYLLAVRPFQNAKLLLPMKKRLFRNPDALVFWVALLMAVVVVGVTVCGWSIAAPMIFRISWEWSNGDPPIIVPDYAKRTTVLLSAVAVSSVLVRMGLAFLVQGQSGFLTNISALAVAFNKADLQPALSRRLPKWGKAFVTALVMTMMLSGLMSSLLKGVGVFAIITALLVVHGYVMPKSLSWNSWAKFTPKLPIFGRWVVALLISYALGRSILLLPYQSSQKVKYRGAFDNEIAGVLASIVTMLLLFPGLPRRKPSSQPGSISSASLLITLLVGATTFVSVAPTALASCLETHCCFNGLDWLAALLPFAIIAVVFGWLLALDATLLASIWAMETVVNEGALLAGVLRTTTIGRAVIVAFGALTGIYATTGEYAVEEGTELAEPLSEEIANTFTNGTYTKTVTTEETILWRVWGDKAEPIGSYWSRTPPISSVQAIESNALDSTWGNTAESVVTIRVPAGTTIYEGTAASQGVLSGGGNQIFIPTVNPIWVNGVYAF